jgi:hypothetical protein
MNLDPTPGTANQEQGNEQHRQLNPGKETVQWPNRITDKHVSCGKSEQHQGSDQADCHSGQFNPSKLHRFACQEATLRSVFGNYPSSG